MTILNSNRHFRIEKSLLSLDLQGFWPDGIYSAPCDEGLRYDIEAAKSMGLNMLLSISRSSLTGQPVPVVHSKIHWIIHVAHSVPAPTHPPMQSPFFPFTHLPARLLVRSLTQLVRILQGILLHPNLTLPHFLFQNFHLH